MKIRELINEGLITTAIALGTGAVIGRNMSKTRISANNQVMPLTRWKRFAELESDMTNLNIRNNKNITFEWRNAPFTAKLNGDVWLIRKNGTNGVIRANMKLDTLKFSLDSVVNGAPIYDDNMHYVDKNVNTYNALPPPQYFDTNNNTEQQGFLYNAKNSIDGIPYSEEEFSKISQSVISSIKSKYQNNKLNKVQFPSASNFYDIADDLKDDIIALSMANWSTREIAKLIFNDPSQSKKISAFQNFCRKNLNINLHQRSGSNKERKFYESLIGLGVAAASGAAIGAYTNSDKMNKTSLLSKYKQELWETFKELEKRNKITNLKVNLNVFPMGAWVKFINASTGTSFILTVRPDDVLGNSEPNIINRFRLIAKIKNISTGQFVSIPIKQLNAQNAEKAINSVDNLMTTESLIAMTALGGAITLLGTSIINGSIPRFLAKKAGIFRSGLISDFLHELEQSKLIFNLKDNQEGTASFFYNKEKININYDIKTNRYKLKKSLFGKSIDSGRVIDLSNQALLNKLTLDIENIISENDD